MKIPIHIGFISENAVFMQFYIIIQDILSFIQTALTATKNNW